MIYIYIYILRFYSIGMYERIDTFVYQIRR